MDHPKAFTRRSVLHAAAGMGALGMAPGLLPRPAIAQAAPLKVGLMLP